MQEILRQEFEQYRTKGFQASAGLEISPIFRINPGTQEYNSLHEALETSVIEITEVSEGGRVPDLKVLNRGDKHVLLLDGEELRGAKQNRIPNTSILVPAGKEITIPVSCVEAGRWSYRGRSFRESGNVMPSIMRSRKSDVVSRNLNSSGEARADQSQIWNEINHMHREKGTHSDTSAMEDMYGMRFNNLDDICGSFPLLEGQCGICVQIGRRFGGIDLVSRPEVWKDVHNKIVRSYAIEVLDREIPEPQCRDTLFEIVLGQLGRGNFPRFDGVGLGEDIRFDLPLLTGSALVWEKEIIHLGAYLRMTSGMRDNPDLFDGPNGHWNP
jgi:hypothetical protein